MSWMQDKPFESNVTESASEISEGVELAEGGLTEIAASDAAAMMAL